MIDMKNAIIRTIETRLAMAENMEHHEMWISLDVMRDILELLKEQEAVEPIMTEQIVFGTNRKCSKCNRELFPAGRYCPHCGRLVKWDDAGG